MIHAVEFADTDMAGIVHFANYFRYMERTEHDFYRTLGLSAHMTLGGRRIGWPRVRAECEFSRPLRFEDRFEVHLRVLQKRPRSLVHEFVFRLLGPDGEPAEEVARGRFTIVCVAVNPGDPATPGAEHATISAIKIPPEFASRIDAAPADHA